MISLNEVIDGLDTYAYFNLDKNEIFYIGEYDIKRR